MNDTPPLAPPGAGLPTLELLLSRMAFSVLRYSLNRRTIQNWLCSETDNVLSIARGLSSEHIKRQVLIPKLGGLEDNSRNWSAAMVLQHLVIVDSGIRELLCALSEDRVFEREVRIADVKPSPAAGLEQLEQLETALRDYLAQVTPIKNLHTARHHAHPWFGLLDAHGWHTLAALHTMIHRRQLDIIVRLLK